MRDRHEGVLVELDGLVVLELVLELHLLLVIREDEGGEVDLADFVDRDETVREDLGPVGDLAVQPHVLQSFRAEEPVGGVTDTVEGAGQGAERKLAHVNLLGQLSVVATRIPQNTFWNLRGRRDVFLQHDVRLVLTTSAGRTWRCGASCAARSRSGGASYSSGERSA